MNRFLLDTHYILWLLLKTSKIKQEVYRLIQNAENNVFYSDISLWEIAVKIKVGKLHIDREIKTLPNALNEQSIKQLSLKQPHLFATLEIPLLPNHQDPFDRLLIAQAKTENLTIITDDPKFNLYENIEVLS